MSPTDLIILGIIAGFGLFGLWFGIVSTVGSLLGTALGVFIAGRIYYFPAAWLINITGWTGNFPDVVSFIVCFLIINRLVGFAFHLVDKILYPFTNLPYISGLNKTLGMIFGVFEGVLVVGVISFVIDRYPLWPSLMSAITSSKVITICWGVASFLWPLLPDVMKLM